MNYFNSTIKYISFLFVLILVLTIITINPVFAVDNDINTSFKQVKTADNSTVYYIDHSRGMKKAYVSEAGYLSYGNNWSDIHIVSNEALSQYANINLVKTADSPAVYYIYDGNKSLIVNEETFNKYGFRWENIVTVSQTDFDSYNTTEFKYGGSPDIISDGDLFVSLNSNSPKDAQISTRTNDNLTAIFTLRSIEGDTKINGITIKLDGIFNRQIIDKIYLRDMSADDNEKHYGFINNKSAIFNLNNNPIIIASGAERDFGVFVNLKETDNFTFINFWVAIESPSAINSESVVSGSFPLSGYKMSLVDGSDVLARVRVEAQSLTASDKSAVIGNTGQRLAKYKVNETSNNEDVVINKLVFKNNGNAEDGHISNFILKDKNNKIIAKTSVMSGREVSFNLNNYLIKKNSYTYFTMYADIVGGDGKTIDFDLTDAVIIGQYNNYSMPFDYYHINEDITIKRELLGVFAKDLKPGKNTFNDVSGSLLGVFEIRNNKQTLKLKSASISIDKDNNAPAFTSPLYLVDYDSGELIASENIGDQNIYYLYLGDNELGAKKNIKLAFISSISEYATSGTSYAVNINKIVYDIDNRVYYMDEVNVAGKAFTVSSSHLAIYPNNDEGDLVVIKGQKKVKVASFIVESAAGDDIWLESITISKGDTSGVMTYNNGFSNIKLYISSKAVGTIKEPYTQNLVFDDLNFKLSDNSRKEIKVYADIDSDAKASELSLSISNIVASSYTSRTQTSVTGLNVDSNTTTIGAQAVEMAVVSEGQINAGEDDNLVGSFVIRNTGQEDVKLKYLTLTTSNEGFSYSLGFKNLEIREVGKNKRIGRVTKPVANSNKIKLTYKLKAGEEKEFKIVVDATSGIPTENFSIKLKEVELWGYKSKITSNISINQEINTIVTDAPAPPPVDEPEISLAWPVNGDITYGFHDPSYPFGSVHEGIDINVSQGTNVKAAEDGIVVEAHDGGMGYSYVAIDHGNNLTTVYGHLSQINVEAGQSVNKNNKIGESGGTPGTPGAGTNTNGPHLHFEVHLDGIPVDPIDYLN